MSTETQDSDEIWAHDTLNVDEDGFVAGSAYTVMDDAGRSVQVSVSSYEYEHRGEMKMNHVPNVVIVEESGSIIGEPYAHDSGDPEAAIDSGKSTAEWAFKHLESFL